MATTPLADGGRLETYTDAGYLYAQKYDASGAKVGPLYQTFPGDGYSVEALSNGGYVLAVDQNIQYGHALSGALFDPAGTKLASLSTPGEYDIQASSDGAFLVVSRTVIGGHPPAGIVGDSIVRVYANDGTVLEDAKVYAGGQIPSASVNGQGDFVVSWNDGGGVRTLTLDPQHPIDLAPPATPTSYGVDDFGPTTGNFTSGTTDDTTPTFHVSVTEVGRLGYALINAPYAPAPSFTIPVTAADVARGYIDITTGPLTNGTWTFVARTEDATGVVSGYNNFSFDVAAASSSLSISGPGSLAEGDSGTTDFAFTVTRSGDASGAAAVDYYLWPDQADTADFAGQTTGTAYFSAGQTTATIHIPVAGDTTVEANETFHVGLSNARGASIATGETMATIVNDDTGSGGGTGGGGTGGTGGAATVAIADLGSLAEGNSGATDFAFTVTRSGDSSGAVAVDYYLWTDQTDAADFAGPVGGTVRFAAGQTSAVIHVPVAGDTTVEGNETFHVELSNARGATIADGEGTATIVNDDGTGSGGGTGGGTGGGASGLTITGPGSQAEGNAGTTDFAFTVTRGGDASGTAAADYYLWTDQTDASDFAGPVGGTVRFAAGQTTATIHVPVAGDTTVESDETFHVELSNARGTTIASGEGTATILNDDGGSTGGGTGGGSGTGTLSISGGGSHTEGDTSDVVFDFTVLRTGSSAGPALADYFVWGDTDSADFTGATGGTVRFADGQTSQVIHITIHGDTTPEPTETFHVNLSNPRGAVLGTDSASATILDNDGWVVS